MWDEITYLFTNLNGKKGSQSHKVGLIYMYVFSNHFEIWQGTWQQRCLWLSDLMDIELNHWLLREENLKVQVSNIFYRTAWALAVKLITNECHWTSPIRGQHRFRLWLVAVRQKATKWACVDPDLCCHMVPLGHNELIHSLSCFGRNYLYMP